MNFELNPKLLHGEGTFCYPVFLRTQDPTMHDCLVGL